MLQVKVIAGVTDHDSWKRAWDVVVEIVAKINDRSFRHRVDWFVVDKIVRILSPILARVEVRPAVGRSVPTHDTQIIRKQLITAGPVRIGSARPKPLGARSVGRAGKR